MKPERTQAFLASRAVVILSFVFVCVFFLLLSAKMRTNWIYIYTGYPVSKNTLSFIAATHTAKYRHINSHTHTLTRTHSTFGGILYEQNFSFVQHWKHQKWWLAFICCFQWLSSAHTKLFILLFITMVHQRYSIEYHPGSLMGLDFSIINVCLCVFVRIQYMHTAHSTNIYIYI